MPKLPANRTRQFHAPDLVLLTLICASIATLHAQTSAQRLKHSTNTSSTTVASPILLVQSDTDCTFALDDEASQMLRAGEIKRVPVVIVEHLVTAVTTDGIDRWKMVVNSDRPGQRVVLIELLNVKSAREKKEREALQLEHETNAKNEQAKAVGAALAIQKKQRAEIGRQIDELQAEMHKEEAAAQHEEANAVQLRQQATAAATQGTSLGQVTARIGTMGADNATNSARAHRVKVSQMQGQIGDLNRMLEKINRGESVDVPDMSLASGSISAMSPSKPNEMLFRVIYRRGNHISRGSMSSTVQMIRFRSDDGKHDLDLQWDKIQAIKKEGYWGWHGNAINIHMKDGKNFWFSNDGILDYSAQGVENQNIVDALNRSKGSDTKAKEPGLN
jgi:hypothetical protein